MKRKSIKKLTVTKLLQIFFIAISTISLVMFFAYKEFFNYTAQSKAIEMANAVKAGLTSHMKAGIMDKRDYFLQEMHQQNYIIDLNVIRGEAVEKQFGKSTHKYEKNLSDFPDINLEKNIFVWNEISGTMKAIIPYKASKEGDLNCLMCHNVSDGTTLGALELELDMNEYQSVILEYIFTLAILLTFFSIMIVFVVYSFLEKYIGSPITRIADDAEEAYENHKNFDIESYETLEFYGLARNLNDLNSDIIAKERELQEKNIELEALNGEIELTLRETMVAIGEMEEVRSKDVKNHTRRVSLLSGTIAKDYGLSDEDVKLIELTSPLHDIGKIGIRDAILLKPGKLTPEEYEIMKTHAEIGHNILSHSKRLALKTAGEIAYGHHEKFDGTGYPQGLKGEEIPIFARIVAIVDVLDALLSSRVYKKAWTTEEVIAFVIQEKGKHFDPVLVEIVEENFDRYSKLIESLIDFSEKE